MTPLVSIFASANRPHYWLDLIASVREEEIPVEFVFCGPSDGNLKLPPNFKFIQSNEKPATCVHLAYQQCQADYVLNVSDDWRFGPGAISQVMSHTFYQRNPYTLFSMQYRVLGNIVAPENYLLFTDCQPVPSHKHPMGMVGGVFKKETWDKLGGIDQRFEGLYVMEDMVLRYWAAGGGVSKIEDEAYLDEVDAVNTLHGKTGDWDLLKSLWVKDGIIQSQRLQPVLSYP